MTEDTVYEMSQAHFDLFVKEAESFIEMCGLKDWKVFFKHADLSENETFAECSYSSGGGKNATICLSEKWPLEFTDKEIRRCAYHEVCHLLLADSDNIANYDDLSAQQKVSALDRAHHAVIRQLENAYL